MAVVTEIMEIKKYLMQQHIIVSYEWVEACINFLKEELGQAVSLQNLMKNVYQQWLVSDLEELSCPSLPHDLPTIQKTTLNNNLTLQIQGIRDISKPAYSQLKQLENSENSNADFSTAPKEAVPEWEAKPTRMLMLNLTDGCIHIQGMEYKTINFLSPNLPPGIKVLIKGPVDCRFGVLLLTADNIQILGGEVESKSKQFSRLNLLREQLQLPPEEAVQEIQEVANQIVNNRVTSNSTISGVNQFNYSTEAQQNVTRTSSTIVQPYLSSRNRENNNRSGDILDDFESDDDFERSLDYGKIDEIENTQRQVNERNNQRLNEDLWQEDEDMIRDMMEFQDRNQDFEMPFEHNDNFESKDGRTPDNQSKDIFTYLSTVVNDPASNCVITIKGFIITVLSKLECTPSKGWSLIVKINDGSATVDASIHDKVLEGIIGVSAQEMIKKQALAAQNLEIKKQVMEAISKCKLTLQNYNCLMDVKFTPGEKPCIVKCYPVSELHIQQLLERASAGM